MAVESSSRRLAPPPAVDEAGSAFGRRLTADERKQLVVGAAARLFDTHGYHGTSIQAIASEVGVTKAAIYHYVDSKEELLYEIHDAFISTLLDEAETFFRENDDPREQIRQAVRSIFRAVAEYQSYVRAFFRDFMSLNPDVRVKIEEKRERYEKLVEGSLETGIKDGVFTIAAGPKLGALFLFGACNWSYQWMKETGSESPDELADSWWEMLMKAFAAEPG